LASHETLCFALVRLALYYRTKMFHDASGYLQMNQCSFEALSLLKI